CLAWLGLHPWLVFGFVYLTRACTGVTPLDVLRGHLPILAGLACMTITVLLVQGMVADLSRGARLAAAITAGVVSYSLWMLATARNTILADFRTVWRELRRPSPKAG